MSGMEAAITSGLLKEAVSKLVSLIAGEFNSITGVKKDLSKLQVILEQITRRLSHFQERETGTHTSFSLVKLKDVANVIVDLLDEVHFEAEKKNESDGDKHSVADFFCAKPKSLMFQCKMAKKIKAVKVRLKEIMDQTSEINALLQDLPVKQSVPQRNCADLELYLLADAEKSKIPKRDNEKDKIISRLVESNEGQTITVLSVVGIGGSGKTTLAKSICNHEKIKEYFKGTIFKVHVSEEFDLSRLVGKLFEAVTKAEKSDHHYSPYHMISEISNKLRNKKFLLILDDAWQDDWVKWEEFMVHIKCGAPGSMVLVTTRHEKVAEAVKSQHIFRLLSLTELESWRFFLESSEWPEEALDSEHIQLVKEILRKCGGVPLAIKILGGVLHGKMEINILRVIRGSNLWEDKEIEDQVFLCLRLSYIHLEDHLKQCFTFCSVFPKGCRINKNYLIEQWIVHGFIKQKKEEQPEDTGSEYFNSLVKAGFLQDPLQVSSTDGINYKMHDLIHDLAQYILQTELFTTVPENMSTDCSRRCKYLSLTSYNKKVAMGLFHKLRALFVSEGNPSFDKPAKKSIYTRSVVLDYATEKPFPLFLLSFENLGYLEIHNLRCKELPEAISGCWNLKSLHFIHCKGFVTLPKSIGKLKKMRSLELKYIADLETLPQSIGECQDLQSFQLTSCRKLREIPGSIGRIKTLRWLKIAFCSSLQQPMSDFTGEYFSLQTINLYHSTVKNLPSTLVCPVLHTLDLSYTEVTVLPHWVTSIGTIECIELAYCVELVELPEDIGTLKRLAVLNIEGCTKLRHMPSGIAQLTRLRKLGLFVVGCGGDDARISELENLDMLSGSMTIKNLKLLMDPCDAEKARMNEKSTIHHLVLDWSFIETEEELVLADMDRDQGVLNALEPSSQIKDLEIKGYRGLYLPWWLMKQNDSSYCGGTRLRQTAPYCHFLSLTYFWLQEIPNLKQIRGVLLPSLLSLRLYKMPNLEELWTTTTGSKILDEEPRAEQCFPALNLLGIIDCPKLSVKPYFPPSLETLRFGRSNFQLLSPGSFLHQPISESSPSGSMHSVVSLRNLELSSMEESSSGWVFLQHCTELVTLTIQDCNLTQLPESIRSLTSLKCLSIYVCPSLAALPAGLGDLSSLRELTVARTPMLASFPQSIEHLTSLETLQIDGWSNLKQLPDGIQHLTSLKNLILGKCDALAVLPEWIGKLSALRYLYIGGSSALQSLPNSIQRLTALRELSIVRCPALQSLPNSIQSLTALRQLTIASCPALQSLPSSIQRLTALQELWIRGCPDLARRYKPGVGPDWCLVKHVPKVDIDD